MFFGRNRVDEDLARIQHENLPEKYPAPEKKRARKERTRSDDHIGAKDVFAMIIAVFSLVLPYVIVFVAIMALIVMALGWLFA